MSQILFYRTMNKAPGFYVARSVWERLTKGKTVISRQNEAI